jgi:hypothetical protein
MFFNFRGTLLVVDFPHGLCEVLHVGRLAVRPSLDNPLTPSCIEVLSRGAGEGCWVHVLDDSSGRFHLASDRFAARDKSKKAAVSL